MKRNEQIDFVKCVMILLMIAFHLVYIGDTYGAAKAFVYTFHMPVFLFLSGLLINIEKPWKIFWRSMMFIAIPYAIMETGYIIGASILPIREHIDNLTPLLFVDKLVLNPIGPYWYLQTIVICSIIYKIVSEGFIRVNMFPENLLHILTLIVLVGLYEMTALLHFISWTSYMYFTFGVICRMYEGTVHKNIIDIKFFSHWSSIIVLALLAVFCKNPYRGSISGIVITVMAFCASLELYKFMTRFAPKLSAICLFVGRNTLLLLLFSPIFTILAKGYQPLLLSIDPSGMIFMIVSIIFAVVGSLAMGWTADKMKVAPYIFGRKALAR